jgi:ubiquinone/menaquinone biosynthesis C-methylase UbiE
MRDGLFPVLDLCCGPGAQIRWLAGQGRVSCGLDINLGMLKYAAGRRADGSFVCADAVQTPFPLASFKGIVVSFALHEKPAEIRPRLLAEAKRLLLPNGRIILVDFEKPWNSVSRLANLYIWLIERLAGRDHFHNGREFLAKGGLRDLLKENGLREVERHDLAAGSCALVLAAIE